MAKTKYDFAQDTQYGRLIYKDVPSYSPDFLGTAGDAVLVRQFIKNYLPFYKTSVTSSRGSAIRVNIVETAWFANYSTNNSVTKVNLTETWLGDIIEPLFEGKGFDGMQDLEYSKPLPKLINTSDPNQDVSYGHNYIFVDAKDLIYKGYINLDDYRIGKGYLYQIFDVVSNYIKTGYVRIPKIIVQYIKGEMTAPNEGDLVTLEKGEENTNPYDLVSVDGTVFSLTEEQIKVLNALLLNENKIAIGVTDLAEITEYPEDLVINVVNGLEVFKLIDVVKITKQVKDRRYAISKLGKKYLEKKNRQNRKANLETPTNGIQSLTTLEQEIIDFLAENGAIMDIVMNDFYQRFPNYDVDLIVNKVDNLVANDLVKRVINTNSNSNEAFYILTTKGENLVTSSSILTLTQLYILELLAKKTTVNGSQKLYKNELVKMSSSAYDDDMIDDILRVLINRKYVNQVQVTNTSYQYNITELGFDYLNPNAAPSTNFTPKNSNLSEAKETFVDSLSSADGGIYTNAVYEFVNKNSDTFTTMGKEDPDLYSAILGGLSFVLGQQNIKDIALEPFKPVENQQELEDDLISEDDLGDLDLGDLDLEEIDLSGLEDDIQINDEDLGDLSDFDELKEFVENELEAAPEVKLLPSQYNVLKVLYDNNKRYPMADNMSADSIRIVLEQDNIVYAHNQILKYLGELVDFEFISQKVTLGTGLIFSIIPEGIDYVENKIKINMGQSKGGLRPSPSESATLNVVGNIKTGNDGNSWEVKENKNGVKRWVKL